MNAEMIVYDQCGVQVLTCENLLQLQADEGVDLYTPKCWFTGLNNFLTSTEQETVINVLLPNKTTALSIYVDKGVVTLAECNYDNENKTIVGPDQHGVLCSRPLNNKTFNMEELKNLLD